MTISRPLLARRCGSAALMTATEEVRLEDEAEAVHRDLLRRTEGEDAAGLRDHGVEVAVSPGHVVDQGVDGGVVGDLEEPDVELDPASLAALVLSTHTSCVMLGG
ncbi:hypothetical protein [Amycolatopsis sp. DSM 110486]|uniref:hypothetical protein n=1 Tax=Amycolatopsis sp. DSM 110486 TaxID=2865832 RepID=UPI001C69DA31|nr:hypothetical protein [Amycolatopsis sp. DSM 110486]QYN21322.1 hypothetical protein K1T34_01780 [Amycolatopsis sp. DSM 110486]